MTHRMSKDRIFFRLDSRYYQSQKRQNGMSREMCRRILLLAFNLPTNISCQLMERHSHEITILCRPSQFARFIVFRQQYGDCVNGVSDLRPEIFTETPEQKDYEKMARQLSRDVVCTMPKARQALYKILEKTNPEFEAKNVMYPDADIDVSQNQDQSAGLSQEEIKAFMQATLINSVDIQVLRKISEKAAKDFCQ